MQTGTGAGPGLGIAELNGAGSAERPILEPGSRRRHAACGQGSFTAECIRVTIPLHDGARGLCELELGGAEYNMNRLHQLGYPTSES